MGVRAAQARGETAKTGSGKVGCPGRILIFTDFYLEVSLAV